jgi:hypothetical protein
VVIPVALALERLPERADVELASGVRIGSDHRHRRQEVDLHAASSSVYLNSAAPLDTGAAPCV